MSGKLKRRALFLALLMLSSPGARGRAETPRTPFLGVFGATAGAGSHTGWHRHGSGHPAASGPPGWSAAAAGYAPYGLEDLSVAELSLARDAARWGGAVSWRAVTGDAAALASRVTASAYRREGSRLTWGAALASEFVTKEIAPTASLGAIWRPTRFIALGGRVETDVKPSQNATPVRGGLGFDCGTSLGGSASWRVAIGRDFGMQGDPGLDFGLSLQLHELLGIHAGLAPRRETFALGIRFGFGAWEGHSALQRHARLGSTSVQGLAWREPSQRARPRRP